MSLDTRLFQVNTDREFYEQFIYLSERFKNLGSLFQNPNTTATNEEVAEWDSLSDELIEEIEDLLREASGRIIRIR